MYLMGYNGDPNVFSYKEWYFNESNPLKPACVDQQTRPGGVPWYSQSPMGTLGVRGCEVDESVPFSSGLYNQCQWDAKTADQACKCVRLAGQASQHMSKCKGANPLAKLTRNMCRTNNHKPCACFTAVSWSTSATGV